MNYQTDLRVISKTSWYCLQCFFRGCMAASESETDCIWIKVTVNNGGPLDSRLHWEVVVFLLIYGKDSFIYSPFTWNKRQAFSLGEINSQGFFAACYFLQCVTIFFRERLHETLMCSVFTEKAFTSDFRLHREVCPVYGHPVSKQLYFNYLVFN